jgi:hypothetical protein
VAEDGGDEEERLAGGGRTEVTRRGSVVFRASGPWSATVLHLLRHLESVDFRGAPRVVGTGFDRLGRETVSFVEGWTAHPAAWPAERLPQIGVLLRQLHDATRGYVPPSGATWRAWFGRRLGDAPTVVGHCDVAPWILLARGDAGDEAGMALIDWENAGPVDPLVELAQTCWLNAQLHDDDVAALSDLASPEDRARHLRLIADGYRLPVKRRARLVELMIELAVQDAAQQARDASVTPTSTDPEPLWAVTWRVRSAAWMLPHRRTLERALR